MCQGEGNFFLLEQALEQAREALEDALIQALHPILFLNHQRGRFQQYLDLNPEHNEHTYIHYVADFYKADHTYVHLIQQEKSTDQWAVLISKIQRWAYCYLQRWALSENVRLDYAQDIAQDSGKAIGYKLSNFVSCQASDWLQFTYDKNNPKIQKHSPAYTGHSGR